MVAIRSLGDTVRARNTVTARARMRVTMRVCVLALVALTMLPPGVGGWGLGRGRHGRRDERSERRERHGWRWQTPSEGWKSFVDSITGRHGGRRFGVEVGYGKDDVFNFDFGWNHGFRKWWEGPNVCVSKSEKISNSSDAGSALIGRHFSILSRICDESESAFKCTSTYHMTKTKKVVTEVFECCRDYSRKEKEFGCPRKVNLKDIVQTAGGLGLSQFLRAADSVSMTEELRQGNFTVFAPVNAAFDNMNGMLPEAGAMMPKDMGNVVMVSKPISNLLLTDMQNLLLGHLAVGQFKVSNLQDEQLVETGSPYKAKIRINFYNTPQKLMTANCVRVIKADHVATNGIIHQVESFLQPVTGTIVDHISKSHEFGYFKTAIARAQLVQMFREDGQFTVFAPTDAAFRKLGKEGLDGLLNGDATCLKKVLMNHVLPNVICSEVIRGHAQSPNMLSTFVNLTRDEDGKIFVQDAQMVGKDIMTSNGVIHAIDTLLMPDEALGLADHLQREGLTQMAQHLKATKVLADVQKLGGNATIFVPNNQAFENLPKDIRRKMKSDPEYLRKVLHYHVVPRRLFLSRVYNNYQVNSNIKEQTIRINEYSLFPFQSRWRKTAQCGILKKNDIESCNTMINIVDKVLLPPDGAVVDVLSLDKNFTILVGLIKHAGLADQLQGEGPFTFFAPTNKAFRALGNRKLEELQSDKEKLILVLKNHLVNDYLCCAGIFESGWYGRPRLQTVGGRTFDLDRQGQKIKVGSAKVVECDRMGTNGVVHVIDRVLVTGERDNIWDRLFGGDAGRGWWQHGHNGNSRHHWDWL